MSILSYPLRYLSLRNEAGGRLYRRDLKFLLGMTAVIALPFILLGGNFFGAGGLMERIGSFASVLTGFYIAALVGVASLSPTIGDLDEVISQGPISGPNLSTGESEELTRRQYVCSLFGYLAFVSLFISISTIIAVGLTELIAEETIGHWRAALSSKLGVRDNCVASFFACLRGAAIAFYALLLSHIVATTCHGLYYYIERLYAKKPTLGTKSDLPGA